AGSGPLLGRDLHGRNLDASQHRMAAMLALHVLGAAHPADGLMLSAVGALRDELEAAQAVDAHEPPGQLRRAQPRLAATGAIRSLEAALGSLGRIRRASQAAAASFRHMTTPP